MTEYNADRQRGWRLSFWPVLAFACFLPLLLALGAWQVQRGIDKQRAYDNFAAAGERDALDANRLTLDAVEALPPYSVVSLRGRYLPERQMLLDNMPRAGRPGHHVFTPFVIDDAEYVVVVDRGWRPGLARGADRAIEVSDAERTLIGRVAPLPRPALRLDAPLPKGEWPRIVQFPDRAQLAAMLEQPVADVRLLLADDMPDGFERGWTAPGFPPARHYGYAATWFGLALALIVIFVLLARPGQGEDPLE